MTEQDTGRSQRAEAQPPKAALSAEQKKMLQAKHRVEEAEARNRKKERNARTRRLIQERAILERVFPRAQHMDPEALKAVLEQRLGAKETNNGD